MAGKRKLRASGGWGGGGVDGSYTQNEGGAGQVGSGGNASTGMGAPFGRTWGAPSPPPPVAPTPAAQPSPPSLAAMPQLTPTGAPPSPPANRIQPAASPPVSGGYKTDIFAAGGYSGLDRAMSEHADRLHPVKRR